MADMPGGVPETWSGSTPEYYIYWAMFRLGYKDRFDYQVSYAGGRQLKGGTVIDFFIPELNMAIFVQSIRYHYASFEQTIADSMIRAMLEGQGIKVIYIDEADALSNPTFYLLEATKGQDHSLMATR